MTIQYYATFDQNWLPVGFYNSDVHGPRMLPVYGPVVMRNVHGPVPPATPEDPDPVAPIIGEELDDTVVPNPPIIGETLNPMIPEAAIVITYDQWQEFLNNQGHRKWDPVTETVIVYTPPVVPASPYVLKMSMFWEKRIADDDEYDAVIAAINSGTPRQNRQAFMVAQTLTFGSTLFLWAKALFVTAFGATRADELLAAPTSLENSSAKGIDGL